MVKKFDKSRESLQKNNIKADVIILGCSLPGIVTAHKLKMKFGNSMDIVVLDLAAANTFPMSKCNVVFQEDKDDVRDVTEGYSEREPFVLDNVAKLYLSNYAKDFNIPIPDVIISPKKTSSPFCKMFQYKSSSIVDCKQQTDYHDFSYLNFIERFELNQYQDLLDHSMADLFNKNKPNDYSQTCRLRYYDQTTMETHICSSLIFPTPREIMRMTVRLVCGAEPEDVSALFYLHQCYRTSSSKNHLDGDNTRFREKLLGHCRKRIASKLQQSIADITLPVKPIKEIRTYSDETVIVETKIGENNYVCNLLAMAVRPDELDSIRVDNQLLPEREFAIATAMMPGRVKKFLIQYEYNFWNDEGRSGDILSIHGPIMWAMERPILSSTGDRYAGLVGFLKTKDGSSEKAVVEQLVRIFGRAAANPVSYRESEISDLFIPRCGDYVALRRLTGEDSSKYLEWGALDIFADGDIAAAIEAGHTTYVRVVSYLRPQAQDFEDCCITECTSLTGRSFMWYVMARLNLVLAFRLAIMSTAAYATWTLLRMYIKK